MTIDQQNFPHPDDPTPFHPSFGEGQVAEDVGDTDAFDLAIVGGHIVFEGQFLHADLYMKDGRVAAICNGARLPANQRMDAAGCWILPGAIDVDASPDLSPTGRFGGAHLREFLSNALRHGITTACLDFPASWDYNQAKQVYGENQGANIALRAAVCKPDEVDSAAKSMQQGALSVRANLRQIGALAGLNEGQFREVLRHAGQKGRALFANPEHGGLGEFEKERLKEAGGAAEANRRALMHPYYLGRAGLRILTELLDLERDVFMAFSPVTTCDEVNIIAALSGNTAIRSGAVTPLAYLLASSESAGKGVSERRLPAPGYPPLRSEQDRNVLVKAAKAGLITAVSGGARFITVPGSSPKAGETSDREQIGRSVWDSMFGLLGVGEESAHAAVRLLCDGPAKLLGLFPHKGTLRVGADADCVVVNPGALATNGSAGDEASSSNFGISTFMRAVILNGELVPPVETNAQSGGRGKFAEAGPSLLRQSI